MQIIINEKTSISIDRIDYSALISCEQQPKPDLEQKDFIRPNITNITEIQKSTTNSNTKHVYVDSEGNQITIVNSLP